MISIVNTLETMYIVIERFATVDTDSDGNGGNGAGAGGG
jgi:hypothetical protein